MAPFFYPENMEIVKKVTGVPKSRALEIGDIEVVQLGGALVVRGSEYSLSLLGGTEQAMTDYDWFKLFVLGDEF